MRVPWVAIAGLAACVEEAVAALSALRVEASHGEIVDAFDADGWSVSNHIVSKNGYRGYFAVLPWLMVVSLRCAINISRTIAGK